MSVTLQRVFEKSFFPLALHKVFMKRSWRPHQDQWTHVDVQGGVKQCLSPPRDWACKAPCSTLYIPKLVACFKELADVILWRETFTKVTWLSRGTLLPQRHRVQRSYLPRRCRHCCCCCFRCCCPIRRRTRRRSASWRPPRTRRLGQGSRAPGPSGCRRRLRPSGTRWRASTRPCSAREPPERWCRWSRPARCSAVGTTTAKNNKSNCNNSSQFPQQSISRLLCWKVW